MRLRTTPILLVPAELGLATASHALTKTSTTKPAAKAAAVASNVTTGKKTRALLVGFSNYESSQISHLTYPASDVAAIAQALEDPTLGNVPADHIKLLTNEQATAANIKGAVDDFFKPNVKPGDSIIIFLAGHGVAKGVGTAAKGYLLPYDVHGLTMQALDASAVNLRDLSNSFSQLPAAQFIAFVDACREDPTPGRGLQPNNLSDVVADSMTIAPGADSSAPTHPNAVTFFACSVGQRAYEDQSLQHGVFTYNILNALKTGDVCTKPNGAIDMGLLAADVGNGVSKWAADKSSSGDFEVDQTPQLVPATNITAPVTLIDVARPYGDPIQINQPPLIASTFPQGANVKVDGRDLGAGTVQDTNLTPGTHTIEAIAPGYGTYQKTFNALPGYPVVITAALPPAGRGVEASSTDVPESFTKSQSYEQNKEYDAARAGYKITISQHPNFAQAYESLARLERLNGSVGDEVGTLIDMTGQVTPNAHDLAQLAMAYTDFCNHGPGKSDGYSTGQKGKDYKYPKSQKDAGELAVKAANAAVAADSASDEAQRALGFALIAQDNVSGKNKNETGATNAFSSAIFADDKDAANHYGVGHAKRFYGQNIKDKGELNSRMQAASVELKQAVQLRPNYYEAHLELGYCYHLMDDRPDAEKEYQTADALRGQADDPNEVAGAECAMSALYGQDAKATNDPDKKDAYQKASKGFADDAKDLAPDLKVALGFLRQAGLSTNVMDYLPDSIRNVVNLMDIFGGGGGFGGFGGFHNPFGH